MILGTLPLSLSGAFVMYNILKMGLINRSKTPEAISSLKNENNVVEMADKRRAKTSATVADSESADSGLPSDNLEIEKLQVLRIGSERRT